MNRLKRVFWATGLVFVSIGISVLTLELGLRLFWDNPFENVSASRVVEMRMQEFNLNKRFDRSWLDSAVQQVAFRTNKKGVILPADQYNNPDKTILFMGGSTTECSYVQEDIRFPALVSTLLGKRDFRVNTLNAGRSGNTLHDSTNLFLNEYHKYQPDYVVVMHATNDGGVLSNDPLYASRLAQPITASRMMKWVLKRASSISLVGYLRIGISKIMIKSGQKVSETFSDVSELNSSETDFHPFYIRLNIFVDIVRHFGSKPILMTQPMASVRFSHSPEWANQPDQFRLNELIRKVAREKNVPLIDLSEYVRTIPDFSRQVGSYLYDGMHVTDKGSQVYATYIANQFAQFFNEQKDLSLYVSKQPSK